MKIIYVALTAVSLMPVACKTSFTGGNDSNRHFSGSADSNQGGDSGAPGDHANEQHPSGINVGVGDGSFSPATGPGNTGAGTGGSLPGGSGAGGGGGGNGSGPVDTSSYFPMKVKVHRRDKGPSGKYDHTRVVLAYQVIGANKVESGTVGKKSETLLIERACPPNGPVNAVIQFQLGDGTKVSPSKQASVGGPIGYRRSPHAILVGFEKEAVNNPSQAAYHNNDDLVIELTCESGATLSIANLCLDQRIPDDGWDLVSDKITYSGDQPPKGHGPPARLCNGA